MSRVLIAWEIGGFYGHLGTQLPIAHALRYAGYDVLFTTPDSKVAAQVLEPRSFPFVQSPRPVVPAKVSQPPATYAEMLLAERYGDFDSLLGRVMVWLRVFDLAKPRLAVIDHAPTALLAARVACIPTIQVGHGFFIPPDQTPLPGIRPWEPPVETRRFEQSEALVLSIVNRVLCKVGATGPLSCLSELFTYGHRVLTTFRELDHFEGRIGDEYAGPLFGSVERADLSTAASNRAHTAPNGAFNILAYVHDIVPGWRTLIEVLSACDARTLCIVPQLDEAECLALSSEKVEVSSRMVNLAGVLPALDLVICGGIGMLAQTLLAGVPVLLAPATFEQYLLGLRAQALGVGKCLGFDRSDTVMACALEEVLKDLRFREAAAQFAQRHRGYQPDTVVQRVLELAQQRLQ